MAALGVGDDRVYVDHGLTGANRDRPGLRQALAACRAGDTLVVTKLDRLARSLPDAREILEDLTRREVKLSIGASVHDPTDAVGRLLFNVLAMVAEFEADLIRLRTKEGMRAKGRLRGKQPKLNPRQEAHLVTLFRARAHGVRAGGSVRHHAVNGVSRRAAGHPTTGGWRNHARYDPRAPLSRSLCGNGTLAAAGLGRWLRSFRSSPVRRVPGGSRMRDLQPRDREGGDPVLEGVGAAHRREGLRSTDASLRFR